jgi:hypothetical protein
MFVILYMMNKYLTFFLLIIIVVFVLAGFFSKKEGYGDMNKNYSNVVNNMANQATVATSTNSNGTKETTTKTNYDSNNYNIQYHDTEEDLKKQLDEDLNKNTITVKDSSGNITKIPWSPTEGNPTYYEPGSIRFGPSNYVPSYEDSVFYSRLTGLSYAKPVYNTASQLGGFCSADSLMPEAIEKKCNSLDLNTCASTSCCVLLGGSKCVSGDENGPKYKSNYGDISIKNKDQYYYQGQCYGNCKTTY